MVYASLFITIHSCMSCSHIFSLYVFTLLSGVSAVLYDNSLPLAFLHYLISSVLSLAFSAMSCLHEEKVVTQVKEITRGRIMKHVQ